MSNLRWSTDVKAQLQERDFFNNITTEDTEKFFIINQSMDPTEIVN